MQKHQTPKSHHSKHKHEKKKKGKEQLGKNGRRRESLPWYITLHPHNDRELARTTWGRGRGGWKKHHAYTIITATSSNTKQAMRCKHNPIPVSNKETNKQTQQTNKTRFSLESFKLWVLHSFIVLLCLPRSSFVGALSPVSHKGLHQGWTQTSLYLQVSHFTSHHTISLFFLFFLAYLYSAGTQHGNLHPAG